MQIDYFTPGIECYNTANILKENCDEVAQLFVRYSVAILQVVC